MVGNDSCDRGRKALAATALGVVCCCSATDLCPDSYFSQADQMIRLYMDHFRACRSNISNRRHQSTAKRPRISVEVQKDGPLLKRYRCVTTARFKKAVIEIICLRIKAGGDDRELMIFHRLPPRGSAGTFQPFG